MATDSHPYSVDFMKLWARADQGSTRANVDMILMRAAIIYSQPQTADCISAGFNCSLFNAQLRTEPAQTSDALLGSTMQPLYLKTRSETSQLIFNFIDASGTRSHARTYAIDSIHFVLLRNKICLSMTASHG